MKPDDRQIHVLEYACITVITFRVNVTTFLGGLRFPATHFKNTRQQSISVLKEVSVQNISRKTEGSGLKKIDRIFFPSTDSP